MTTRLTKMQRIHLTPYNAGYRKGRQNERKRILRILRGRVDPYDDNCIIFEVIRRIKEAR